MKPVKQLIEIEIAEWKLAKAKGECNQWGDGYIRGLEVALEWITEAQHGPEATAPSGEVKDG